MKNNKQIFLAFLGVITLLLMVNIYQGPSSSNSIKKLNAKPKKVNYKRSVSNKYLKVVTVDSCEYVVFDKWSGGGGHGGITHKGNCKFCLARNKK